MTTFKSGYSMDDEPTSKKIGFFYDDEEEYDEKESYEEDNNKRRKKLDKTPKKFDPKNFESCPDLSNYCSWAKPKNNDDDDEIKWIPQEEEKHEELINLRTSLSNIVIENPKPKIPRGKISRNNSKSPTWSPSSSLNNSTNEISIKQPKEKTLTPESLIHAELYCYGSPSECKGDKEFNSCGKKGKHTKHKMEIRDCGICPMNGKYHTHGKNDNIQKNITIKDLSNIIDNKNLKFTEISHPEIPQIDSNNYKNSLDDVKEKIKSIMNPPKNIPLKDDEIKSNEIESFKLKKGKSHNQLSIDEIMKKLEFFSRDPIDPLNKRLSFDDTLKHIDFNIPFEILNEVKEKFDELYNYNTTHWTIHFCYSFIMFTYIMTFCISYITIMFCIFP